MNLDSIVALALILSVWCGLLACANVGRKLWKYCRLTLKSLAWARRERGYMARWVK